MQMGMELGIDAGAQAQELGLSMGRGGLGYMGGYDF